MPQPHLTQPRAPHPAAIALVLHGGRPASTVEQSAHGLALLRMLPIAWDIEHRSHGQVGAAVLRNAVRGWNEPDRSPVADARWALDLLAQGHPGIPIGVVGHSMGGRTALAIAADPRVRCVVGLAPWKAEDYPETAFAGTPLLVVHGRFDRTTDARTSRQLVERVTAAGGAARYESLADGHAMLLRAATWHRLVSRFLVDTLITPAGTGG